MAGTLAFSSAGATLSISAGTPATIDEVGFEALSYTVIAETTDLGAVGPESSVINHSPTNSKSVFKLKSIRDNGTMSVKAARIPSDPGQQLVIAAEQSYNQYTFKLALGDDGNQGCLYFQGLVTSYKTQIGTNNQITGVDINIAVSGDVIFVEAD